MRKKRHWIYFIYITFFFFADRLRRCDCWTWWSLFSRMCLEKFTLAVWLWPKLLLRMSVNHMCTPMRFLHRMLLRMPLLSTSLVCSTNFAALSYSLYHIEKVSNCLLGVYLRTLLQHNGTMFESDKDKQVPTNWLRSGLNNIHYTCLKVFQSK